MSRTSFFAKGRRGLFYLETGANQRPSKVIYDREHSAIALARTGAIAWEVAFRGAGWLQITGLLRPSANLQPRSQTNVLARLVPQALRFPAA